MPRQNTLDAVILCGGLGTRLRSVVSDRPKAMAPVNRRPFLDILIKYAGDFGYRRFILSTGYMSGEIRRYYAVHKPRGETVFSTEKELFGTGGAVKKLARLIRSDPFLVMNGDSFCGADLDDFLSFHSAKMAAASMVVTRSAYASSGGCVNIERGSSRINAFNEKRPCGRGGWVNAGIYLFSKGIFSLMPDAERFSLEHDFFPRLTGQGLYAYRIKNVLIDIGTPEGLRRAEAYFARK